MSSSASPTSSAAASSLSPSTAHGNAKLISRRSSTKYAPGDKALKVETVCEGYLEKKSPRSVLGRHAWQKRYFVLTITSFQSGALRYTLYYYRSAEERNAPLGLIEIDGIKAVNISTEKNGRFDVVIEGRTYSLRTDSSADLKKWTDVLADVKEKEKRLSKKMEGLPDNAFDTMKMMANATPATAKLFATDDAIEVLSMGVACKKYDLTKEGDAEVSVIMLWYQKNKGPLGTLFYNEPGVPTEEDSKSIPLNELSDLFIGKHSKTFKTTSGSKANGHCVFTIATKTKEWNCEVDSKEQIAGILYTINTIMVAQGGRKVVSAEEQKTAVTPATAHAATATAILPNAQLPPTGAHSNHAANTAHSAHSAPAPAATSRASIGRSGSGSANAAPAKTNGSTAHSTDTLNSTATASIPVTVTPASPPPTAVALPATASPTVSGNSLTLANSNALKVDIGSASASASRSPSGNSPKSGAANSTNAPTAPTHEEDEPVINPASPRFVSEDGAEEAAEGASGPDVVRIRKKKAEKIPAASSPVAMAAMKPKAAESEVGMWLLEMGAAYSAYVDTFYDNGVNMQFLLTLTEDDLQELGVSSSLHRKKILHNVEEMKERTRTASSADGSPMPKSPQSGSRTLDMDNVPMAPTFDIPLAPDAPDAPGGMSALDRVKAGGFLMGIGPQSLAALRSVSPEARQAVGGDKMMDLMAEMKNAKLKSGAARQPKDGPKKEVAEDHAAGTIAQIALKMAQARKKKEDDAKKKPDGDGPGTGTHTPGEPAIIADPTATTVSTPAVPETPTESADSQASNASASVSTGEVEGEAGEATPANAATASISASESS